MTRDHFPDFGVRQPRKRPQRTDAIINPGYLMTTFRSIWALTILAVTLVHPSLAQVVRGTVLDDSTSQPIGGAAVTVLDTLQVEIERATTDSAGRFVVAVSPGTYLFRILRIGYTPTVTTLLRATGDADEITVVIRVPSTNALQGDEPFALAAVVVEAQPPARYLSGFYRHQAAGQGEFAHREQFEQWNSRDVTDVLLRMQTFSIRPNSHHGLPWPDGRIDMREHIIDVHGRRHSGGIGECPPVIFLDGTSMGNAQSIDINTLPLDAIEAVEAFARPIQTPLEYVRPGNECGVVALWTRAAESGEAGSPFEFGFRYGGSVAGEAFAGGRIGAHFVAQFKGPFEIYPALYWVSSAFSSEESEGNSGWMAQIALRTTIHNGVLPVYVGTGLLLVKRGSSYISPQSTEVESRHTLFTGLKHAVGPLRPFVEFHVIDIFAFDGLTAQLFLGAGLQF
jgi:hypothetical protein